MIASFIIHYLGWQARKCKMWIVATDPLGACVRSAEIPLII